MTKALFEQLLGESFSQLPKGLQEIHSAREDRKYSGPCTITRGSNLFARMLASFIGFPPAGDELPFELEIQVREQETAWLRNFNGHWMRSRQWARDGLLIEKSGPGKMALAIIASPEGLRYEARRAYNFGIPLPGFLSPKITAFERYQDGAWHFDVKLELWLFGLLVRYQGQLRAKDQA